MRECIVHNGELLGEGLTAENRIEKTRKVKIGGKENLPHYLLIYTQKKSNFLARIGDWHDDVLN